MQYLKVLITSALGATLAFAGSNTEEIEKLGMQSTKLLLKTLGTNMKAHMKHGGPLEALDFCSQEAYTLTESVNKKLPKNVHVKRISIEYRNPLNKPSMDEAVTLLELEALHKQGKLPKYLLKKVDANTYKFYKPLVIKKGVCLKCHGDIQNKKLAQEIQNRYPQDKALHYKMGDLRGAVVTTITE